MRKAKKVVVTHHKRVKNPTTNYAADPHKVFCKRCREHNGLCPMTGKRATSKRCSA